MKSIRLVLLILLFGHPAFAAPPTVRAELGSGQNWVGQGVPLVVTLYSPGPFSGTPAFDLPEIPRTVIVKTGNPVVGNEDVGEDSYFTQRHEFRVYTQQTGEVMIPSFSVRYSGKKTFTSDPVPMSGETTELKFQSQRPPGTETMGLVISVASLEVKQTWNPANVQELQAGDVIERSIARRAGGTTAMILPEVKSPAPDGVQVYSTSPQLQDRTDRGEVLANRVDLLKYQFQQPGTFTLPELRFVWWNSETKTLQTETIPGLTVNVRPAPASQTDESSAAPARRSRTGWWIASVLIILVLLGFRYRHVFVQKVADWSGFSDPRNVALRKVRASCAENQPQPAYAGVLEWVRASDNRQYDSLETLLPGPEFPAFQQQWQSLTRLLFAEADPEARWQGDGFWRAFSQAVRRRHAVARTHRPTLPPLNPVGASDGTEQSSAELTGSSR